MRRIPIRHAAILLTASAGLLLLAACGSTVASSTVPGAGSSAPLTSATATATPNSTVTVSATALPLGDGHVATSPRVGYVDSCQTTFNQQGGAQQNGPWIHGDTWDPAEKLAVQGAIKWSQATYSAQVVGSQRVITTRDVPVGFPTGIFPIAASDPAYAYDRNPNSIAVKSIQYTLPAHPTVAATPTCVNMGTIGVLTDGVVLFNALDAEGRDAAAHEVLDTCGGHPQMDGEYHHHDIPPCLLQTTSGSSTLVGYALDGFGIYVERDAQGKLPTNADLDACHGRTSPITWDGQRVSMYHYVATAEYPYTIGCFMGTPIHVQPGA